MSLATALRTKAARLREICCTSAEEQTVRDAADLLRVLANIVDGMPLKKAFGAPGDWGYDTDVGREVLVLHRALYGDVGHREGYKLVPMEPPHALLGLLTGYDGVEHMTERDRNVILERLRERWAAILAALPDAPGAGVPVPPGECSAPDCDCEPGWCRQQVPATFHRTDCVKEDRRGR